MTVYLTRTFRQLPAVPGHTTGKSQKLVPFCSPAQRWVLWVNIHLLASVWSYFWAWWICHVHRGLRSPLWLWTFTDLLLSAAIAVQTFETIYSLALLVRAKVVDPESPVPVLRVAMITTRAPSEEFGVLQDTLKGMLSQKMPYDYHVWLADERPTTEVLEWCYENGVNVSSRYGMFSSWQTWARQLVWMRAVTGAFDTLFWQQKAHCWCGPVGVTDYHRPVWPRRTKCKEGNLIYFYVSPAQVVHILSNVDLEIYSPQPFNTSFLFVKCRV